jgi:hypothetical protein
MFNPPDYHKKFDAIDAVDPKNVKSPKMPVAIFIQEVSDLYAWCQADRQILESKGLDWPLVEELPEYLNALIELEGRWNADRKEEKEEVRKWKEKASAACTLRNTLLHDFRYAFHNNPELLAQFSTIANGYRNADIIQDLSDLSVLGKTHPDLLAGIHFNTALLDQAANQTSELARLLASVNFLRKNQSELRILRDKAFSLCKNRIDTIRDCGKYALWDNPERKKGYASEHRRKRTPPAKTRSKESDQV